MVYSQIVAEGRLEKLKEISEHVVNQLPCRVIMPPSPGLVMIKHVDSLEKTPFYLGEAYVTQCEVEIDGHLGYGCVLGEERERALYSAIIDSIIGNSHPLADQILPMLEEEQTQIQHGWAMERKQTERTKVNFDVKKG